MKRAVGRSKWESPIVRSFWEQVGGRCPTDSVQRVCDRLTEQLCKENPPFQSNRYEYAELLGIRVIEQSITNLDRQGTLSICGDNYLIVINKHNSAEQKNFTVCHEVGHVQMLKTAQLQLGRDRVMNHLTGSDEEERLSNAFAVNLLMPRKQFKKAVTAMAPSMNSLIKLHRDFGTSLETTAHRILDLDLWPCILLWCSPEKLYNGDWVLSIARSRHSASIRESPVSGRFVRWGVAAAREACENKVPSSSPVVFRKPHSQAGERWRFDCLRHNRSLLALMVPEAF